MNATGRRPACPTLLSQPRHDGCSAGDVLCFGLTRSSKSLAHTEVMAGGLADLLLVGRVEDLRRKVFELAAIIGGSQALVPIPKLPLGRPRRSDQWDGSIRGFERASDGPGALVGVRPAASGAGGFKGRYTPLAAASSGGGRCQRTAQVLRATLGYAEKVRSQFLSLRHIWHMLQNDVFALHWQSSVRYCWEPDCLMSQNSA